MPGKGLLAGGGGSPARKHKRVKVSKAGTRDGAADATDPPTADVMRKTPQVTKKEHRATSHQPHSSSHVGDRGKAAQRTKPARSQSQVEAAEAEAPAKKKRKRGLAFWDSLPGWREVEVGDEFLLGAEEGGFAGLEVLEDPIVLNQYIVEDQGLHQGDEDDDGDGDGDGEAVPRRRDDLRSVDSSDGNGKVEKGKKGKKEKKEKEGGNTTAGSDGRDEKVVMETAVAIEAPAAAAAAVQERKRRQRERMKAKKARRKERRIHRPGAGGGDSGPDSGAEASDADNLPSAVTASAAGAKANGASEPSAKRCKKDMPAAVVSAEEEEEEDGDGDDMFDTEEDEDLDEGAETEDLEYSDDEQHEEEQQDAHHKLDLSAWREFELHSDVIAGLAACGFSAPTPIQRECLHPAIRARADIIGAAQTGSGKTLAFGLPIMHLLASERTAATAAAMEAMAEKQTDASEEGATEECKDSSPDREGAGLAGAEQRKQMQKQTGAGRIQQNQKQSWPKPQKGPLRALILTPTRELALQVCTHLQAIGRPCGVRVAAIVGGISDPKQARLLAARPAVLVATPGRLWDLMCRPPSTDRNGPLAAAHLADLNCLSFLVLDEADRMVAQGHYKELSSILERLPHPANRKENTEDPEFAEMRKAREKERRMKEKQQHPKKLKGEDEEGQGNAGRGRRSQKRRESDHGERLDDVDDEVKDASEEEGDDGDGGEDPEELPDEEGGEGRTEATGTRRGKKHLMQTFVFSATLTLPLFLKKRLRRGGGGAGGSAATLESLMDRVPFRISPQPRVVDLTPQRRLADRVTEAAVSCLEAERDEVLYYLLAAHPGRTLVFANAVSAIRRVAALLKVLGLPAIALHAQQQQRQRLKALDRFRADSQSVLVATDVAARGLDIPGVATVIHYQLPASADTYIHRCGRTARGLDGDGIAIALVGPRETARFTGLVRVLGRDPPPSFPIDQSLMPQVRARVRLAIRLDEIERKERKQRAEDTWRRSNAKALGLDVDDDGGTHGSDADDDDDNDGASRRLRNGRQARPSAQAMALRQQLAALLAEPLAPKMSRRYFTGGLAAALATRVKEPATSGSEIAVHRTAADTGKVAEDTSAVPGAVKAAVPKAVALATKLHQSHQAAAAAVAAANAKRLKAKKMKPGGVSATTNGKANAKGHRIDPRLMVSRNQLKKKHYRGMVVIPQAFGRDAAAPNALDALRARVAALGPSSGDAAAAAGGAAVASGVGGK
ncbi:hypothetical protein Vretimale_4959, partial [Volvox reticuliferus]